MHHCFVRQICTIVLVRSTSLKGRGRWITNLKVFYVRSTALKGWGLLSWSFLWIINLVFTTFWSDPEQLENYGLSPHFLRFQDDKASLVSSRNKFSIHYAMLDTASQRPEKVKELYHFFYNHRQQKKTRGENSLRVFLLFKLTNPTKLKIKIYHRLQI